MASKDLDELAEEARRISRRFDHDGHRELKLLAQIVEQLTKQLATVLAEQERTRSTQKG